MRHGEVSKESAFLFRKELEKKIQKGNQSRSQPHTDPNDIRVYDIVGEKFQKDAEWLKRGGTRSFESLLFPRNRIQKS
ncbi:hypothetical protein AYB33_00090 [Leptospira santarosai]|nr:hypothetical protein AYB33_00090 [Leptospira santarosai]